MRRDLFRLIPLLLGAACLDKADDTAATCPTTPEGCEAASGCSLIEGRELSIPDTGGSTCYNLASAEPLGCQSDSLGCAEVITFATAPEGGVPCYQFNDSCVPEGWVACETDYNSWSEC